MKTVEYNKHDNTFLVSEERVDNSFFLMILEYGSTSQVEKALRERVEKLK